MQDIILLKNLYKNRTTGFSIHIKSFAIKAGELIALVGPSGCGKSTALDIMAGILCPDFLPNSKSITHAQNLAPIPLDINIDDTPNEQLEGTTEQNSDITPDIDQLSMSNEALPSLIFTPQEENINILNLWQKHKQNELARIRRKYIGYVLQTGGLLPFLTGIDNILLACHNKQAKDNIENLADTLDIAHLLHKKPLQMSVGERQRFAIARALVHSPKLILADEPVASLDPLNAKIVLKLFTKLAKEQNISVIMVSHSPELAKDMGFRLVAAKVERCEEQIISHITMEGVA